MADSNVTPYLKINELIEEVNAQKRYIAEVDALFRTMAVDSSLFGWAARKILRRYISNSAPPSTLGMRKMDIPPIVPDTLEIVDVARNRNPSRKPARGKRDIGGSVTVHSLGIESAQSDGGPQDFRSRVNGDDLGDWEEG